MSANSFVVDLRKSMVITDPNDFPMNMEKSSKEDYPVDMYPILAYTASNVLGTAFGYKSFFEESTKLDIGLLDTQKVQAVFTYQSSTLDNLQWALCEDGIYVAYATLPTGVDWVRVVDLSADMEVDVRRLWSYAVIANKVYLYQQGADKFWAIVDPAKYAEAASPSLIDGATIAQVWTNWGCGLISYVPSFLNMAGQIGIFRADNRLGFWDSDSSVGWSSAVAIEDFTPSVTTFAGSTKFADVQGTIVKILGSGDGFIIYASRSIVNCQPLSASPEKWEGEAIFSNIGISFDTQVVAAQPDQIHYAITAAGLVSITNGNPEYIATEVMDFLVENSPLYSLFLIEGRYLFLATGIEFPGSTFSSESILVSDPENNEFWFPKPTYPALEDDPGGYMEDWLAGREAGIQQALEDFETIVDPVSIPEDSQLVPCFDVTIFKSTFADTTFTGINSGDNYFYSKITPAVAYFQEPSYRWPVVTNNFIEEDILSPGDFPPLEMAEKLNLGMTTALLQTAYQDAFEADASNDIPVDVTNDWDQPPEDWDGNPITVNWDTELVYERNLFNCLNNAEIKAEGNECRMRLYYPNYHKMNLKTYFTGVETYEGGTKMPYFVPRMFIDPPALANLPSAPDLTVPKSRIVVPVTADIVDAFKLRWLAVRGAVWVGDIYVGGAIAPGAGAYVGYCIYHHFSQCEFHGISAGNLIAVNADCVSNINGGGLYSPPATEDINPLYLNSNLNDWAGSWYHEVDGASWVSGGSGPYWRGIDPPDGDWGPYPLAGGGGFTGYITYLDMELSAWTELEKAPYLASGGVDPIYRLVGTLSHVIELQFEQEKESTIWEAELSGWGYYPTNGASFRKTHNRKASSGTCPMPSGGVTLLQPPTVPEVSLPDLDPPNYRSPPVIWDYPDSIPLPDNYALFNKGSLAAYYPTYNAAVVYDLLLTKWGMYNNNFRLLQELMPVNRVDGSIMPVSDKGMFGGALNPAGECTVFKDRNPASSITYGKMGFYRHGMNFASGAIAHFGDRATGTLIVESSMDGVLVDPDLSYAVSFEDQRTVFLPFTSRAKWFNIRVEGNFNLVYLELSAESRGRR